MHNTSLHKIYLFYIFLNPETDSEIQTLGPCAYRHVRSTAGAASLGLRIYQSAANAKITQFDLPFGIQQDIRWLHVSVNDTMFLF